MATPQGLSLTVNPSSIKVPADYGTYKGHVVLINSDHGTITVTPARVPLSATGHHGCAQVPPTWLTLADSHPFKLAPGGAHSLAYTVHAAPGVNGTAAIIGEAVGAKTSAGQVGGAVGMKVTVGTGSNCAAPKSPVVHNASPFPWGALIGVLVILILAAVVVRKIVKSRKGRH